MEAYNLLGDKDFNRDFYNSLFEELSHYEFENSFVLAHYDRKKLPKTRKPPILILIGDEAHRGDIWNFLEYSKLIFKNYGPLHQNPRIIPLPLPISLYFNRYEHIEISKRPYDYCLLANCNQGIRTHIYHKTVEYCRDVNQNGYLLRNRGYFQGLPISEYSKILHTSKICICPPGLYSNETMRYVEAAAAGCILVCPKKLPFWYYQNPYEFGIPDWNLLPELLDRILNLPEVEINLAGNTTREYYENFLSPQSVAAYMKYFVEKYEDTKQ